MRHDALAHKVTGKAAKYLRIFAVLLIGTASLLGILLAVVQSQHAQAGQDFTENANVHVIAVTASGDAGQPTPLKFSDITKIEKVVSAIDPSALTTGRFDLDFGVQDSTGRTYFITGLGPGGQRLIDQPSMPDGDAFSTSTSGRDLKLSVPKIRVEAGGLSSASAAPVDVPRTTRLSPNTPLQVLSRLDDQNILVNGSTFAEITKVAYGVDWATFQKRYDDDNPYGVRVLSTIFVYVDDLGHVDQSAQAIEKAGFDTDYTFRSFTDMSASLNANTGMGYLIVAAATLFCLLFVFLNLNSWLTLSNRDMGVMKNLNLSPRFVITIYRTRMRRLFAMAAAIGIPVSALALLIAPTRFTLVGALVNAGAVAVLLLVAYVLASRVMLARHARRPVLDLMRLQREFD
ncbi:hypothetical protein [Frondihabitans sp. Leaf304]|uniref:hypothetical protein n=1 Tax=Frondihabitans sp. Leaf304 TaxID=1736329 RepID=UPI0006F32805|nr:hypothetical protein [Frondihabitans sp. Leaf304]KQQ28860.1 hypothetical protein ASF54_09600 [Frondihabitans sp. Leaf304]